MDESTTEVRRIDAEEANRLAQEFDTGESGGVVPSTNENADTQKPHSGAVDASYAGGRNTEGSAVFPPDIDADATVGNAPDEKAVLQKQQRP